MRTGRRNVALGALACLFLSLIPPASASHYGYSWLVDGLFEGTVTYDEHRVVTQSWPEGSSTVVRDVTYTVNLPEQTIVDLEFTESEVGEYTWQWGGETYFCSYSYSHHNTGPGVARGDAVRPQSNDGHTYLIFVQQIDFPAHQDRSYSGNCPNQSDGDSDYTGNTFQTVLIDCGDETGGCSTADPKKLVGEQQIRDHLSDEGYEDTTTWDLTWNIDWTPPADCAPVGTPTAKDSDGDRLPDGYETKVLGSDPSMTDTDQDCYGDAIEVASGAAPYDPSETPDTLAAGSDPTLLSATGEAGNTCGRTRFRWVTPALRDLGVAKGKPGCVMLLSNKIANAVADYALKYDTNITKTLMKMTRPYMLEIYGEEAVDWARDRAVDAGVWGAARREARKAMMRGLNLTRLNAIFTVGRLSGLNAIALGGVWKLNQIRNKNACIQVRIGTTSSGNTQMSWSLVYSAESVTDPKLSEAGVWKKKEQVGIDNAVRKSVNLRCNEGLVEAGGAGDASKVFSGPVSHVY